MERRLSLLDRFCTGIFALLLIGANIAAFGACHVIQIAYRMGLLSIGLSSDDMPIERAVKDRKEGLSIMATKFCWGAVFFFAKPWIYQFHCGEGGAERWNALRDDLADSQRRAREQRNATTRTSQKNQDGLGTGDKGQHDVASSNRVIRPILLMSNHVSFLDTLVATVVTPRDILWHTRLYMSAHLLKLPFVGFIAESCGHFPVHFSYSESLGKFSLDRKKMAEVTPRVHAHLRSGRILALFPEGQMNRGDTKVLQSFRYGSFRTALLDEFDCRLWALVMANHEKCWPGGSQIGGKHCTISFKIEPISKKKSANRTGSTFVGTANARESTDMPHSSMLMPLSAGAQEFLRENQTTHAFKAKANCSPTQAKHDTLAIDLAELTRTRMQMVYDEMLTQLALPYGEEVLKRNHEKVT
jgi:hypothetical protein